MNDDDYGFVALALTWIVVTASFFFYWISPSIDTIKTGPLNSTMVDDCIGSPPMPWWGLLILLGFEVIVVAVVGWIHNKNQDVGGPE